MIAQLFITVNFMGVYLHNITSPVLARYCRGTEKVTAPLFPALSRRWGSSGPVTNDWCISYQLKLTVGLQVFSRTYDRTAVVFESVNYLYPYITGSKISEFSTASLKICLIPLVQSFSNIRCMCHSFSNIKYMCHIEVKWHEIFH